MDGMPSEMLEAVLQVLDLDDKRSLRATSMGLASKVSEGSFKLHYATKTLRLCKAQDDLVNLLHVTQPGWMGCLLYDLTIVNSVHLGPDTVQPETFESQEQTLTKAFTNLRLNSPRKRLGVLTLRLEGLRTRTGELVPIEKVGKWRLVWSAAASTVSMVARALHNSRLPIESLDVFGTVPRCGLAIDQLSSFMDSVDRSAPLSSLDAISLAISNHVPGDAEDEYPQDRSRRHVDSLCQLIFLAPKLKSLELRFIELRARTEAPAMAIEKKLFEVLVRKVCFNNLQKCALRGISASEADLLAFLQSFSPTSVVLEEMHLHPGTFESIFDYLPTAPHLQYLHLDNLWESRLICFDEPGQPHFPSSEPNGPNAITRSGDEVRSPIGYRSMRGYALGSAAAYRWHKRKEMMYGPPPFDHTMVLE